MIISLIGMSNVGKSYWSKKLEAEGFRRVCCDDLIAQTLQQSQGLNLKDVDDLAAWMGMPFDPGYGEREAMYLAAEQATLEHALNELNGVDAVIDTTGSVIYLPESLLHRLGEVSTVVYLSTTDTHLEEMTNRFFAHPKPLVWGQVGLRAFLEGRSDETTLREYYPELLRWRQSRYEALAGVTIAYARRHDPHFNTRQFLHDVLQHQQ